MLFNLCLRILVLQSLLLLASGAPVNKEVVRNIDASEAVVRFTVDIKASDLEGEYSIVFTDELAKHLSFISVEVQQGLAFRHRKISPPVT